MSKDWMTYIDNGKSLNVFLDKCTGCGICKEVCPHVIFSIKENKATMSKKDFCMECGACMQNCPYQAINVKTGVGCAAAIISSFLNGTKNIDCNCENICYGKE